MNNKKYKSIAHVERHNSDSFDIPRFDLSKCKERYTLSNESVNDENLGRVVRKTVKKRVDNDILSKLKVSDFSLENLISVGYAGFTPVRLNGSKFDSISNIEKQISNL